ncbi:histidine kinase dimerization/phospho-acceptor domain-containing protein [Butyrivibrio sp. VCB2006]|uniref:histidine kinase dimerization/phospho-acceptor domain-containing protein n=1 Tax=Butyrivibrio sp. VCB2006 TaxID=1280679 RepID=UPI0004923E6E|nr:histidine kinase dimerization/phospho-acceptor domain-containing protein [Butyrivibrio sp. VCB2006]
MEKRSMTISRMIGIYIAVVSTLIGFTTLIAIVFIAVFLNGESSFAADNLEKAVEAWIYDCQKCGEINTALFPEGADIIVVSSDGEELFVKVSHSKEKALRKFAQESSQENGRLLRGQDVYLRLDAPDKSAFIHYTVSAPHEYLILFIFALAYLLEVLIPTVILVKTIKSSLRKVLDYTASLKNQDLSVSPINTGIYELDQINVATDGMRRELVATMEDKWKKEQDSKAQMAQIAHDLKTPLTVIRGNADLLMEKEYDEESKESLEAIIRNSEKIAMSVLDILEK